MSNSTLDFDTVNGTVINPAEYHQYIFIGIGISIIGNIVISISLNLQKYTHMVNDRSTTNCHYTCRPLWWLAIGLLALGECGNFTAYGFAPATLIAPLGTTTVVANTFLAMVFLHEKPRLTDFVGTFLAVVGCFLIIFFASTKGSVVDGGTITKNLSTYSFIVYVCIEVIFLALLLILLFAFKKDSVIVLLLIASLLSSFTVIAAKCVSGMVQLMFKGSPQWRYAVFYIMAVVLISSAVVSVIFLNKAMQKYNSTVVVPTHFAFFTISAIVAGVIFFNEFSGLNILQISMFCVGCLLVFCGVYLIQLNCLQFPCFRDETQSQAANGMDPLASEQQHKLDMLAAHPIPIDEKDPLPFEDVVKTTTKLRAPPYLIDFPFASVSTGC